MGICFFSFPKFYNQLEFLVVPVGFEFDVDGGSFFVVVFLVASHFEVFKSVGFVAQTGISHGTQVVYVGVLVEAAVESADAVAGFAIHELSEGQVEAA